MVGTIFDIQRFCIHDGPGIRTTVFMKGCPLKCIWCHNPEGQSRTREIMFYQERCTKCGLCMKSNLDKSFVCPNEAKIICGKELKIDYVIKNVLKDNIFYQKSGGGVTLSGGEPLYQYEFCLELLKEFKRCGLHTAVETCGFVNSDAIVNVAKHTDLFLFDYKETDAQKHRRFTGVDNLLILENLSLLNKLGIDIILRCPIIKGINDNKEHFEGITAIAEKYENIRQIDIEPYHPLGETKNMALGNKTRRFEVAKENEKNEYLRIIKSKTAKNVKIT